MSESKQLTCEKFGKTMSVIGAVIAILGAILIFAKSAVKNSGGLTGFWKEIYDLPWFIFLLGCGIYSSNFINPDFLFPISSRQTGSY